MTFAVPLWLALLALAPLIVYLHLRRREPREVPSTRLWRLVAMGSEPEPRLHRPPLSLALCLQLLALMLLALALAEPSLVASPAATSHVLIVDAGAAMSVRDDPNGPTRFANAIEEARRSVASSGIGESWSVWLVGPTTLPIVLDQTDHDAVLRSLERAQPFDAGVDWGAVASMIEADVAVGASITVMTTAPETAHDAIDSIVGNRSANLDVRSFERPFDNLGLESVAVRHDEANPDRWYIESVVRADGAVPALGEAPELLARFQPDGAAAYLPAGRTELTFNLGGTAHSVMTLDLPGAGMLRIAIDGHDSYAGDNVYHALLDPEPAPRAVAVLSDRPDRSAVVRALRAIAGIDLIVATQLPIVERIDMLVVDGVADPFLDGRFRRPNAVAFIGTGPGVSDPLALEGIDPAVTDWRVDHALTGGTAWGAIEADRAFALPPLSGASTVVRGVSTPLVEVVTRSSGRDVVVAFDPRDANWTETTQFLTFMTDVVAWLVPERQKVRACTVAIPCRVPVEVASTGASLRLAADVVWQWPASRATVPRDIDMAWTPPRAGAWRWETSDSFGWIPVNIAPSAAAAIATAAGAPDPSVGLSTEDPSPGFPQLRWWAVAAMIVVLVEGVIAGRREERFWRASSWRGRGLLAARARRTALLHGVVLLAAALGIVGIMWPRYADDRVLVIVGTSDPADSERLPDSAAAWPADRRVHVDIGSGGGRIAFDVEASLWEALARVDPDLPARVIVAAPFGPTRGDPLAPAGELARRGIAIDVVPPDPLPNGDVVVDRFGVERPPMAGDTAQLLGVVTAERATSATLRIYRDDVLDVELGVDLQAGQTLIRVPLYVPEPGAIGFDLEVETPGDPRPVNNRARTLIDVHPAPKVHLFSSERDRAEAFAEALRLQGFDVSIRPPHTMGTQPSDFYGIDAIVLMNVPSLEMATNQQEALEAYVREGGGGLLITGGEGSFGSGGYFQTPLDRVSPLGAQIPRDAPEVAMLFVLDRSGSMQQLVAGVSRLDVAKEATLTAVELLGQQSHVAIIVFDEEAHLLLPFTSTSAPEDIESALRPLVPGGGTSMHPALVMASAVLDDIDAATKHVIVMTDGLSQPGDFDSAVAEIVGREATVSTVAIGFGADVERVREIARLGGGAAHVTSDFRALPSILAREALLLSGDPVIRELVTPLRTAADPGMMATIPTTLPPLGSFIETSAKADADVVLVDDEGRPLMASWRYGSGRVISFGSQAVGPWAEAWNALEAFPRWWGQWLRWTIQSSVNAGLEVRAEVIADEVWLDVTAIHPTGVPATGLLLQATLTMANELDASTATRHVHEVVPGRYETRLPIEPGDAFVRVAPIGDAVNIEPVTVHVAHAYPARFGSAVGRLEDLKVLALASGGRVLAGGEAAWPSGPTRRLSTVLAWRPWLLIALVGWFALLVLRYAPAWLSPVRRRGAAHERRPLHS